MERAEEMEMEGFVLIQEGREGRVGVVSRSRCGDAKTAEVDLTKGL